MLEQIKALLLQSRCVQTFRGAGIEHCSRHFEGAQNAECLVANKLSKLHAGWKTIAALTIVLTCAMNSSHGQTIAGKTITVTGTENNSGSVYDTGSIGITINGYTKIFTYAVGQYSSTSSVASYIAAHMSMDPSETVWAKASGNVVTVVPRIPGSPVSITSVAETPTSGIAASYSFTTSGAAVAPVLAVNCDPSSIVSGVYTSCIASFTRAEGSPLPAYAVSFYNGSTLLAASSFSFDGDAVALNLFAGGSSGTTYTITASYPSGDSNYPGPQTASTLVTVTGSTSYPTSSTIYSYNIVNGSSSGFDSAGNIVAYNDSYVDVDGTGHTDSWMFGYDSMNRLATATASPAAVSGQPYACWNYDSFGNRLSQNFGASAFLGGGVNTCSGGGSTTTANTQGYATNNQMTSASAISASFGYDGSGNMTDDGSGGHHYLYDAEGRICALSVTLTGTGTVYYGYVYDAEGNRVGKGTLAHFSCDMDPTHTGTYNGFSLTETYIKGSDGTTLSETDGSGTWQRTDVMADGDLVASYDGDSLHFQLTDWLGSRRVQTDYKGSVEWSFQNLPFGDSVAAPSIGTTDKNFTGKERDTESGLDMMGARYYASSMGRFMSPDPSGLTFASLSDPQSFNLYAYARNNPLINTDPSGLDCVYMNDNNDGVESIDHHSDSGECGDSGGTWRDGWVGSGQVSVGRDGNVKIGAPGKTCVQAALRGMIAQTEGTDSLPNGGYGSFAGGGTITAAPDYLAGLVGGNSSADWIANPEALSGHPNVMVHLPRKDGSYIPTTAFGRYQIMARTAASNGFTDFSAAGQDAAANTLMTQRRMVAPAMNGDLGTAISRGANEWASLPGNNYGQGGKNMATAQAAYNQSMASASECQ